MADLPATDIERALIQVAERDTEIKLLSAEVADWRAQLAAVLAEPTHKDGTHCTCVLFLRRQIAALKDQLATREKQYTGAVEAIRTLSASSKIGPAEIIVEQPVEPLPRQ